MLRQPSRRPSLTVLTAVAAVAALAGLTACGPDGTASGDGSGPAATSQKKSSGAKPDRPKAKEPKGLDGDGTYEVGTDIKPGTYRSSGNDDMCYWERQKDAKGELDSILANDNVKGTSYVTVPKSDMFFKTSGCADWIAVTDDTPGAPKTAITGDGMYRIGVDIAPGTYKSAGNSDDACYWERDKDALHGLESITANDNASGTAVVTIGAKDAYFKTNGCKDWKKTG